MNGLIQTSTLCNNHSTKPLSFTQPPPLSPPAPRTTTNTEDEALQHVRSPYPYNFLYEYIGCHKWSCTDGWQWDFYFLVLERKKKKEETKKKEEEKYQSHGNAEIRTHSLRYEAQLAANWATLPWGRGKDKKNCLTGPGCRTRQRFFRDSKNDVVLFHHTVSYLPSRRAPPPTTGDKAQSWKPRVVWSSLASFLPCPC